MIPIPDIHVQGKKPIFPLTAHGYEESIYGSVIPIFFWLTNNLPSGLLEQNMKRNFRKVPRQRLGGNFYSRFGAPGILLTSDGSARRMNGQNSRLSYPVMADKLLAPHPAVLLQLDSLECLVHIFIIFNHLLIIFIGPHKDRIQF